MNKYNSLKEKYDDEAIIFDRTQGVDYPDSLLGNADHLNEKGAMRFTKEIIQYINNESRTRKSVYKN
jgi:hypothetical protein